jgi:hypothetical protein
MEWLNRIRIAWNITMGLSVIALQSFFSRPVTGLDPALLETKVCVVTGAPGEQEYDKLFGQWREEWAKSLAGVDVEWIGQSEAANPDAPYNDRDRLKQWIDSVETKEMPGTYWLILMGHGTHDSKSTKFNLRGADVSAAELSQWISNSKHLWVIAICASSSGPFVPALSGPGRTIITATKSGLESNFSRFGGYLAKCAGDLNSDLDHDHSISVLEAFVAASRQTERYYQENKWLATEHALIDDNGDGKGTSVDFFRGLRAIKMPDKGKIDGESARQLWLKESPATGVLGAESKSRVDEIEKQLEALRSKKSTMSEEQYYMDLERLMVDLAKLLYPDSK